MIMEFKEAYRNAIPEDSRIMVRSKGLMGDKVIIIDPGKPNARKLKANEEFRMVSEPTDPGEGFGQHGRRGPGPPSSDSGSSQADC